MKNTKAFTLIELLVVVLIIGILAAIALPMYTKTVEKARVIQAVAWIKTVGDSMQRFILENPGEYIGFGNMDETDADKLDVKPEITLKHYVCDVHFDPEYYGHVECETRNKNESHNRYYIYRQIDKDGQMSPIWCVADEDTPCAALGYTVEVRGGTNENSPPIVGETPEIINEYVGSPLDRAFAKP